MLLQGVVCDVAGYKVSSGCLATDRSGWRIERGKRGRMRGK